MNKPRQVVIAGFFVAWVALVVCFIGGAGYIVLHFISKLW